MEAKTKGWRCQRDNQNPLKDEEQTMQWPKWKWPEEKTIIYKALHRKLKIEQHLKAGVNSCASEGFVVGVQDKVLGICPKDLLFFFCPKPQSDITFIEYTYNWRTRNGYQRDMFSFERTNEFKFYLIFLII